MSVHHPPILTTVGGIGLRPSVCPSTWQSLPVGWCRRLLFRCGGAAFLQALYGWDWRKLTLSTCILTLLFWCLPTAHSHRWGKKTQKTHQYITHITADPSFTPHLWAGPQDICGSGNSSLFHPFHHDPVIVCVQEKKRRKHTLVSMWSLTLQDETSEELLLLSLWVFKSIMLHHTWFNLFKLQDYTLQFILISVRLPNKYQLLSEL